MKDDTINVFLKTATCEDTAEVTRYSVVCKDWYDIVNSPSVRQACTSAQLFLPPHPDTPPERLALRFQDVMKMNIGSATLHTLYLVFTKLPWENCNLDSESFFTALKDVEATVTITCPPEFTVFPLIPLEPFWNVLELVVRRIELTDFRDTWGSETSLTKMLQGLALCQRATSIELEHVTFVNSQDPDDFPSQVWTMENLTSLTLTKLRDPILVRGLLSNLSFPSLTHLVINWCTPYGISGAIFPEGSFSKVYEFRSHQQTAQSLIDLAKHLPSLKYIRVDTCRSVDAFLLTLKELDSTTGLLPLPLLTTLHIAYSSMSLGIAAEVAKARRYVGEHHGLRAIALQDVMPSEFEKTVRPEDDERDEATDRHSSQRSQSTGPTLALPTAELLMAPIMLLIPHGFLSYHNDKADEEDQRRVIVWVKEQDLWITRKRGE